MSKTSQAKATQANANAKANGKAKVDANANPVAVAIAALLAVDAKPMAKDNLDCALSKRAIAALLAALIAIGHKVSAVTWLAFANLTSAYRHGAITTQATQDGGKNNDIYLRHASLGLAGNARHVWAINALMAIDDKDMAKALAALKVDAKAIATLAAKSKAAYAIKLANVGKAATVAKVKTSKQSKAATA